MNDNDLLAIRPAPFEILSMSSLCSILLMRLQVLPARRRRPRRYHTRPVGCEGALGIGTRLAFNDNCY